MFSVFFKSKGFSMFLNRTASSASFSSSKKPPPTCSSKKILPERLIHLLTDYGFSVIDTHSILERELWLFNLTPKNISAKIHFLEGKNFSKPQIINFITTFPYFLTRSLPDLIVPTFDYVRCLVKDEKQMVSLVLKCGTLFKVNFQESLKPNFEYLKTQTSEGITQDYFKVRPEIFLMPPNQLKEIVFKIKAMKKYPNRKFMDYVNCYFKVSEELWAEKIEAYKKWDLSQEQVEEAFKKDAIYRLSSVKKIEEIFNFFVNTLGCCSSVVLKHPCLMKRSLEMRLVPRSYVYQILVERQAINKNQKIGDIFTTTDERFHKRIILPFADQVGNLFSFYHQKVEEARREYEKNPTN